MPCVLHTFMTCELYTFMTCIIHFNAKFQIFNPADSAEAVEYADCTSAER